MLNIFKKKSTIKAELESKLEEVENSLTLERTKVSILENTEKRFNEEFGKSKEMNNKTFYKDCAKQIGDILTVSYSKITELEKAEKELKTKIKELD